MNYSFTAAFTLRLLAAPILVTLALLLGAATAAHAEGAVAGYLSYEQWSAELQELGQNPLVEVTSLGQTAGGRDVWLATVGIGDPDGRPAILVLGSVDARQQFAVELAMRMMRGLADSAATDEETAQLLGRATFYFIPCPSPDANEAFFTAPYSESSLNQRPADDDGDFLSDEDGPEDLNGDGWITLMRVAQAGGPYRTHPEDPRVMIAADADKNETGQYLLLVEGVDSDGDEQYNEDGPGGVDFNRNFTFNYPYFTPGAGPNQVSEPESRAVADFCFDHPNIALVFSFSPEDNLLGAWQPNLAGPANEMFMRDKGEDRPHYDYLGNQYKQLLPDSGSLANLPPSPAGAGSFTEWAYFHFGRLSLAARGWWPSPPVEAEEPTGEAQPVDAASEQAEEPPAGQDAEKEEPAVDVGDRGKYDLIALQWMQAAGVDGFVDWQPVDDPDFPDQVVEVGGFKPYVSLNPPASELDGLASMHLDYLKQLAGLLPKLEFTSVKSTELGDGLYQVDVTVSNLGYLPTVSALGAETRICYPLRYELGLPEGAELVNSYPRGFLEKLAGNGGSLDHRWLVRAPAGGSLKITVLTPAVGSIATRLDLASGSILGGEQ